MMNRDLFWVTCMELGSKYGCHQRPDRSFFIGKYQFPVCARCTGIIMFSPIAFVIYMFKRLPIKVYLIMIAIMGIDGGLQYFKIRESDNLRRFLTGCIGGFGMTSVKMAMVLSVIKFMKCRMKKYVRLI